MSRGVPKVPSKLAQEQSLSDEEDEPRPNPAQQALMRRLQDCFMHLGMTPFSSRVLMQHISV